MAKQKYSRKLVLLVILSWLIIFCAFSYEAILVGAGKFLAPAGMGSADVVIVEGEELIREKAVKISAELLSSGRASRMVVVLQENPKDEKFFAFPDYVPLLIKDLQALKLQGKQFMVIRVPTNHPITLTEARIVLADLSVHGVRSAILVAEGFHTRRSLWSYKQAGLTLGIEIIPFPCFTRYQGDGWWRKPEGLKEFFEESTKLLYYLLRGYIPIKSLVVT
jgi:hypothetical protein